MNRLILRILFASLWMPLLCIAQTPEAKMPEAKLPEAPTPAVFAPAKLAWMNLEYAMVSCDEGKRMWSDIQKFAEAKRAELVALNKEAETLKTQLEVQGPKLTDEARADLQSQSEAKDTALQRLQQDSQKEYEARRVKMMNVIGKKMQPVIEKVAKAKGLSAVFIFDSARDAWVDPSLNLTEDIIKTYNEEHPVAAPKAAAPPAAPAKTQ
jgi:outer membrane protein